MEIYQRRRIRNSDQLSTAMKYLKSQEQNTIDGAQGPLPPNLAKLCVLPTLDDCTLQSHGDGPEQDIEVGSVYEIDHAYLPPRTPIQLRFIRLVMVSEKTELNVSVRFPSVESLQMYLCNRDSEMYPAVDEKFVMGIQLASKVLVRQVPTLEFDEKKHLECFWLVSSALDREFADFALSVRGSCLSDQLKCNGMLRWGTRRQVKFLGKHSEVCNPQASSSFVEGEDQEKHEESHQEDDEDDDEEEDNEEEDASITVRKTQHKGIKRKRYSFRCIQTSKKIKLEKQGQSQKIKNRCKKVVLKNPKHRWSTERYKLAEKNLLEVMKAKGAVSGKPILRPELRAEARKRIGDTGLLDHLLKHMAGKIAPGGSDRFRRRHNADGAMEYWLENADLMNMRKEAGVQDPYWIPPPGWKPGDCPTQDPIFAKELKLMHEEISKIKREVEEMQVSKSDLVEDMAQMRRGIEDLSSKKKREENQAVSIPNPVDFSTQNVDQLLPTISDSDCIVVPLEKYKKQLSDVLNFLREMEQEVVKLTSQMEEKTRSGSAALIASTGSSAEKEIKQKQVNGKDVSVQTDVVVDEEKSEGGGGGGGMERQTPKTAAEEKAAKLQRLKSGFRICRPQGTFLWPNMVRNSNSTGNNNNDSNNCNSSSSSMLSPQIAVQVEDLFVVPTPPSVSSSTATAPPQLPYHHRHHRNQSRASPVKPMAERRTVKVSVSAPAKAPRHYDEEAISSKMADTLIVATTASSKKNAATLINLNDAPTSTVVMPRKVIVPSTTVSCGNGGCNAAARGRSYSSPSSGSENWLALATPTPPPALDYSKSG